MTCVFPSKVSGRRKLVRNATIPRLSAVGEGHAANEICTCKVWVTMVVAKTPSLPRKKGCFPLAHVICCLAWLARSKVFRGHIEAMVDRKQPKALDSELFFLIFTVRLLIAPPPLSHSFKYAGSLAI